MDPLRLFLLDQGFPVEYRLDTFNTPHTGTTLLHPQNWLRRLQCLIPLRHLSTTSPLDNIFWRHAHFSTNNQNQKITVTSTSISSNSKHDLCYTMAKISPSRLPRHALLSLLSPNSISSLYFFPSYETCSTNANSIFRAAIKNFLKTFRLRTSLSLLYI